MTISYNGECPLCGSKDGMVIKGNDGRFRNMCRVMGCQAYYKPAPFEGYENECDVRNPFDSALLRDWNCSVGKYLNGEE